MLLYKEGLGSRTPSLGFRALGHLGIRVVFKIRVP